MKHEKFIEALEKQKAHIDKVIEKAKNGQVVHSDTETPTPQEQCYINHAGQCGDCDINGGWTGC